MKQSIENEMKKHSLEKSELMNKMIALAEQGKLARVSFQSKTQLMMCIYTLFHERMCRFLASSHVTLLTKPVPVGIRRKTDFCWALAWCIVAQSIDILLREKLVVSCACITIVPNAGSYVFTELILRFKYNFFFPSVYNNNMILNAMSMILNVRKSKN